MQCLRRESCSRVFTPTFTFKAPGLFIHGTRRCFLCPLSTSEFLAPGQSRIPSLGVLCSPGALTFGYECNVYVGVEVGAEDAKVDVIYISFIMSVQYIGYLVSYKDKVQVDNRTTGQLKYRVQY